MMIEYGVLSRKKYHFIITPVELASILNELHFVIDYTGVPDDYVESNPREFIAKYDAFYQKLKNGNRLNWKVDYSIAGFETGITRHIENCKYQKSTKLSIPVFLEPCIHIDAFSFYIFKNQFSTSFWIGQTTENICGLCISFPSKIELYSNDTQTGQIVRDVDLADNDTYNELITKIKSITKPLVMEWNNKKNVRLLELAMMRKMISNIFIL